MNCFATVIRKNGAGLQTFKQKHEGRKKLIRRKESEESKKRILSACVRLFLEKGYSNTRMADIIKEANVSNSTFQNLFRTKDGVLLELVRFMFENQFAMARNIAAAETESVFIYAVETSIQITLAELNEHLREIYVLVYSLEDTTEYIHEKTAAELYKIFHKYMPECSECDFYELEIGSAGIMRAYMAKKCDMYFTLEHKISRFLKMSLTAYSVPEEEQKKIIGYITSTDIRGIANNVMQELFKALAMEFDFALTDEILEIGNRQ